MKYKLAITLSKEYIKEVGQRKWNTSKWLIGQDLRIYVHKDMKWINGAFLTFLTIANINSNDQEKGLFKKFLERLENLKPFDGIYIENVLIERFANFFRKNQYIEIHPCNDPIPSFYKLNK